MYVFLRILKIFWWITVKLAFESKICPSIVRRSTVKIYFANKKNVKSLTTCRKRENMFFFLRRYTPPNLLFIIRWGKLIFWNWRFLSSASNNSIAKYFWNGYPIFITKKSTFNIILWLISLVYKWKVIKYQIKTNNWNYRLMVIKLSFNKIISTEVKNFDLQPWI